MELFKLPEDGWYNIAIPGEFPHTESGTVQVLDEDGMRSMAGEIHGFAADAAWPGLLVDFDHQSLDIDKPSTAAGWLVDAEYRPTGLWAKIRWTSKGREALEGGLFRFISPVWCVADCEELGDKRLRPRHLMNCAVTNCPNICGMVPLSNREAGEKRWSAPARPLGLVAVTPARTTWCGLANRRRLKAGLGVLANAFMTDEQRKAYWASRTAHVGKGPPNVSYDVDPNLAASNAASAVTAHSSGAEDRSNAYSPELLADVAARYELGVDYNGREGQWRSSVAARIKDLEYQRDSLESMKLNSPDPFIKGRLNLQDVRRQAMSLGLNVIDEINAAKAHNSVYNDYLRRKFRIKKEYHGKAGLDAALNRLEREWNEERVKEARFVEQHNNRLNIRIEDINTEISKLTHEERTRIEKYNLETDAAAAKAEAKAERDAQRAEKAREQAAKRAENAAKKAEAEAAAATAQAEADAAKAAAQAQAAADRAAAKAAEAERTQREYAQSSAGLRNYYDFVRAGNFAAAEKLQPGVDHAETKKLLDKLTSSPGFTSQNSGFQQQIMRQIEHTNPSEVVSMYANKLKPLLNRCDMVNYVLKNFMTEEQRKAMFAKMSGSFGSRTSPSQIIDTSKPGYFTAEPGTFGWGYAPTMENLAQLEANAHELNLQSAYAALGTQASSSASTTSTAEDASTKTGGGSGGWLNLSLDEALSRLDSVSGLSSGVLANAGPMTDAQRRAMFARMHENGGSPSAYNPYALDDRYRYAFESEEGFEELDRYLDGLGIDWSGPQMTKDEFKKAYDLFDRCNLDNIVSYTRYEQRMNGINSRSDALSDLSSLFDGIHSRMNEAEWKRQHGG